MTGLTVVMATHNRALLLPRALRSITAALHGRPYVICIADDASTDDTPSAARHTRTEAEYQLVYECPKARSVSEAKNRALKLALPHLKHYPWVAFMDDDDEMLPGRLAMIDHLEKTRSKFGVGNWTAIMGGRELAIKASWSQSTLLFPPGASMIHRDLIPDLGNFWPEVPPGVHEDVVKWHQLRSEGVIVEAVDSAPVLRYHHSGTGASKGGNEARDMLRATQEYLGVVRDLKNPSKRRSSFNAVEPLDVMSGKQSAEGNQKSSMNTRKPPLAVETPVNGANEELLNRLQILERQLSESPKPFVAGRELVVVTPVCAKDLGRSALNLEWQRELGTSRADLLLVVARDVPEIMLDALVCLASEAYTDVHCVRTPFRLAAERWPGGPEWSFATAAEWCYRKEADFLVLEPDAVPLKPAWFESIVREYRGCGKPYMGYREPGTQHYPEHMAGNGVYHWRTHELDQALELKTPWDVLLGPKIIPQMADTKLIHQRFWHDSPGGKAPLFLNQESVKRMVPESAVVFHRCQDGQLIHLLRKAA